MLFDASLAARTGVEWCRGAAGRAGSGSGGVHRGEVGRGVRDADGARVDLSGVGLSGVACRRVSRVNRARVVGCLGTEAEMVEIMVCGL